MRRLQKNNKEKKEIIGAGATTPGNQAYSLTELLGECYHFLQQGARKKRICSDLYVPRTMPNRFRGDVATVQMILIGLLTHAIETTEEGTITLSCVSEYADNGSVSLKLMVADTGAGYCDEVLDLLCNPNQRSARKKKPSKVELHPRLLEVKQQVDKLGGELRAISVMGKGSVFKVLLPQKVIGEEKVGDIWEALMRMQRKKAKENEAKEAAAGAFGEEKESVASEARIDRKVGLQYCLDEELYRQVLESYLEQGQQYQAQMKTLFQEKNWTEYTVLSHAIKSSSLSIGAVGLSETAKKQELFGKEGNEKAIADGFDAFYREFGAVLIEVARMLRFVGKESV